MQVFAYSAGWADLMLAQLAASHDSPDPTEWGYACLCIGRHFDEPLESLYDEIDVATGKFLHVFSLLPPPRTFVDRRLAELRQSRNTAGAVERVRTHLLALEARHSGLYHYKRRQQVAEKVRLLKELADAGLRTDQYADFLFFSFRRESDDIDIDVIAAKQSPLAEGASSYAYVDLFQRMGRIAEKHHSRNDDVERFVSALSLEWSAKIALRKTFDLKQYIEGFFKALKP
jgi:hypothetical protein